MVQKLKSITIESFLVRIGENLSKGSEDHRTHGENETNEVNLEVVDRGIAHSEGDGNQSD